MVYLGTDLNMGGCRHVTSMSMLANIESANYLIYVTESAAVQHVKRHISNAGILLPTSKIVGNGYL